MHQKNWGACTDSMTERDWHNSHQIIQTGNYIGGGDGWHNDQTLRIPEGHVLIGMNVTTSYKVNRINNITTAPMSNVAKGNNRGQEVNQLAFGGGGGWSTTELECPRGMAAYGLHGA
jgi:hypothetical protein